MVISKQAQAFFAATRLAPPGYPPHRDAHPLHGNGRDDEGPTPLPDAFVALDVPPRKEVYHLMGTPLFYALQAAGLNLSALLEDAS